MARSRIGIWFVGAKGGVATTAIVGLVALKKELAENVGLVSELPQFREIDLADWSQFVVGGHDIRETSLVDEAMRMHTENRAIDEKILVKCKADLERIDARVRPGTLLSVGPAIEKFAAGSVRRRKETSAAAVERVQHDLSAFAREEKLDQVVVMNVASTEPPFDVRDLPDGWPDLERRLKSSRSLTLPASSIYAIAALDLGYTYVNFTPSLGSALPALSDLALRRETGHMGRDGKTGETLLKSTLAPMFAQRNLRVMSWVGHNIFGNMDGQVLDNPENKAAKVHSKDRLLGQIFGYHPQTLVSIEYIESLGDWKTAWDHIHFKGFLNTPMTLQFIWQGCDSLLAAPLVLDLVRFAERARRAGQTGVLTFLSSFFKSPLGTDENDFSRQFQALESWAKSVT